MGGFPYRVDPDVIQPMSEKYTTFSLNVWSPERRKALAEAVRDAKDYISRAIAGAPGIGHGHGPVDHLA